jgi:hypothetical protein
MTTQNMAQGLASLGRNGDSMLVHMQPREVAGLQALAMAHGGSLTINPDTGMPEAFNLGKVLGNVLPVIAGGALSMIPGMTPLTAGLLTGAATWAATGDPLKGVMGGFGAYGGFDLADDLAKFAVTKTAPVAKTALVDQAAQSATAAAAPAISGQGIQLGANAIPSSGLDSILSSTAGQGANASLINAVPSTAGQVASTAASRIPNTFEGITAGASKAMSDPLGFFKATPGSWKHGLTLASPFLSAEQPAVPLPVEEKINYDGPYTMQDRAPRMPTLEETQQMRLAGSPEFNYFGVSNPVPGYMPFAQGGSIQSGGIRDLYGTSDNQLNSPPLSRNGYGLGRLDSMYGMSDTPPAPVSVMASGGPVSFEAGGQIPTTSGIQAALPVPAMSAAMPQQSPLGTQNATQMVGPLAGMNPASIAYKMQLQNMQQPQAPQGNDAGLNTLLGQAIRDPLGKAMAKGGYLDGPGDGMSDSIPATIEGKHPARLADGEFVIPADVVSHLGNGSTKAGAKVLYGMMDKVRKARTGNKKQGRQINPRRFVPA